MSVTFRFEPPPVNQTPVAVGNHFTTDEDRTFHAGGSGVLSNDSDADGDRLIAVLVTTTQHGQLSLRPDGSFLYTPDANFHGADSFTYVASDGAVSSAPTTVTLQVNVVADVVNVEVAARNGAYGVGAGLTIFVTFDQPVSIDLTHGKPTLSLNSGGTASFLGVVGDRSLVFRTLVTAGHLSHDLDYAGRSALRLNGARMSSDLTLPAVGGTGSISDNQAIVIDTDAPNVTGVTLRSPKPRYGVGGVLLISVRFDEAVIVNGVPTLALNSRGLATYVGGSGGRELLFRYVIRPGQYSPRLDYASPNALGFNGGSIRQAGLAAGLTIIDRTLARPGAAGSISDNQAVRIDAVPPRVRSLRVLGFNPGSRFLTYQLVFTKEVSGPRLSDFRLHAAGMPEARVVQVIGRGTTDTVRVEVGPRQGTIKLALLDRDSIRDAFNNPLGGFGVGNGAFESTPFFVRRRCDLRM